MVEKRASLGDIAHIRRDGGITTLCAAPIRAVLHSRRSGRVVGWIASTQTEAATGARVTGWWRWPPRRPPARRTRRRSWPGCPTTAARAGIAEPGAEQRVARGVVERHAQAREHAGAGAQRLARFHSTPSTSAGNSVAAAIENTA